MPATKPRLPQTRRRSHSLILLLLFSGLAQGTDDSLAREWLDRMSLAVNNLSYEGTLVYMRGKHLEAMRIYHRVHEGAVQERLVSLSGPHREVLRDSQSVRCIFPDKQSVLVDSRVTEPWYPIIPPEQAVNPSARYQFKVHGQERVAGLSAQIIHILPKDGYRYGYRLWLEHNTGMLLKSELLDPKGRTLEQLMFTGINIGASISEADLRPDIADEGFVQVEFPKVDAVPDSGSDSDWMIADLPEGFMLSSHRHGSDGDTLEHLVYTDGLASVSVYVEPDGGSERMLSGPGQLGPINMFGIQQGGYAITVVGEVPSATVKAMATSAHRAE